MDTHLGYYYAQLHHAVYRNDTKDLWRTISRCIERALADALELSTKDRKAASGHGKPKMTTQSIKTNMQPRQTYIDQYKATQSLIDNALNCGDEANRCNQQQRRIHQIIQRLKNKPAFCYGRRNANDPNLNFEPDDDFIEHVKLTHTKLNEEATKLIAQDANPNDKFETEVVAFLNKTVCIDTKHIPTLTRMANKYHKKNCAESKKEMRYRHQIKKRNLHHTSKGPKAVRSTLNTQPVKPLNHPTA